MCEKVNYPYRGAALKDMKRINRQVPGFKLRGAYKCTLCGNWHLTSQKSGLN